MIETCCILVGLAIVLDIITGFTGAWLRNEISSQKMRIGAMHKLGEVFAVVLCIYVDQAQTVLNLGFDIPMLQATTAYLVVMELLSIAENIGKMNPELSAAPIFKKLQDLKTKP